MGVVCSLLLPMQQVVEAGGRFSSGEAPAARPLINQRTDRTMSKKDLIDAVAASCEMTKEKAGVAVDAVLAHIKAAMKNGNEVRIPDFGTFKVTKRAAREGRNPATGKAIQIPASVVPKFTPSKGLKDALN